MSLKKSDEYSEVLTIVFTLDEVLPLPEPLHANAQNDCWSFLSLELLIELHRGTSDNIVSHTTNGNK